MYSTPTPKVLASALYQVYAESSHAPDSLELWIAIADKAVRELQMPVLVSLVPWVPIALRYEKVTTDGEFFPHTGSVRIMTGPLTGTLYRDAETAAREVVVATLNELIDHGTTSDDNSGDSGGGEQIDGAPTPLPSWRFRDKGTPPAFTPRAVPPLIS
ncbi:MULTISPECIES: hypothetical protein [Nocardia]|uniref:Uncharacterized protein n=1 Tax=Nocardia asteroides NBRC 15531 TaxID=1110697 RepID=U5EIG3_NOCAS|nr:MULTISPECIES: hypothetical protein [Nocardia]TLF63387.1 hypothetical protein FEK33_25465 [Nocardia asteroides NBRC 15531]UGT47184.1 hypothetical protein LT345_22050 [Nocardia asteroides]SFM77073.1 hypothetical protein SAMN05444423_104166 [Nocardia asteroides]VEG33934.1 Uncharacterised protein [Nocardia asteroides]GAD87090.1 hypothetical protein NCAST_34_02200 [Nocardia asteroides NBRC 15531]